MSQYAFCNFRSNTHCLVVDFTASTDKSTWEFKLESGYGKTVWKGNFTQLIEALEAHNPQASESASHFTLIAQANFEEELCQKNSI